MGHLVFFIVPLLDVDENSPVIFSWRNTDACAGELGTDLIEAPSRNATFGAFYVEGRHWRMVRRLFGQVAYLDRLLTTIINRSSPTLTACAEGNGNSRGGVLNFPLALEISKTKRLATSTHAYT